MRTFRGRGTSSAPKNRFERHEFEVDPDAVEEMRHIDPDFVLPAPRTEFLRDDSQSIISKNSSPDIGFNASLNPYRGCEHGCAYCYARPTHEYLGFSAGVDFESKIMVKPRTAELLESELSRRSWQPQVLACSGVTDCYQPVERKLRTTRSCLEVLAEFRNPVAIITKNHLVTRDIDLLSELASYRAASVVLSITSLDDKLARKLEPRASAPKFRLEAVRKLSAAGIPVGVSLAPVIPGLNDHEMPAILEAAAEAGACFAFYTVVRLPYGVKDLFSEWLEENVPGQREKVLGRIRDLRGGELNESDFGKRMSGSGQIAEELSQMFRVTCRRLEINREGMSKSLSTAAFRRISPGQMELF